MLLSKKGEEPLGLTLRTFISIVISVMIFLQLALFINSLKTGAKFQEHFIARDIATLIDTITIAPGYLIIDYSRDTDKLAINIEKEKVSVYRTPKFTSFPESYAFSEDKNLIYEYAELIPEGKTSLTPIFIKQGNKINILEEKYSTLDIQRPICTEPKGKESLKDKGELINELIEVTDELSLLDKPEFITKAEKGDVVIIITYGDEIDERINPINAYVHIDSKKSPESKYLACLIINKILDNEKLNNIIFENSLTEFSSQNILLTDKYNLNFGNIAILLEIGNKGIPKERNILDDKEGFNDLIKESITSAIDTYG